MDMQSAWQQAGFSIDNDKSKLDIALIHAELSASYWAVGIPRGTVERAIANSLCFGVYEHDVQVGFARVITDSSTFAYLADVFIVDTHRGRGLAHWLVSVIRQHPDLQGLRRWLLMTRDAHSLYAPHGFSPLAAPEKAMEIADPDVYRRAAATP
ncbi:hypothetical protein IGB42_01427 [Andreprevotia sp. IGB-42]|uniref:GNAT family N-acetyltransferase n=1 Tax=Andreprevotia sp. IGB-42 TaxID=2497473 RepID=UPI00157F1A83|nr:GNAT family N-acetyltransferase [Andreprevotia sp. IGB-42]KAF0813748.1 hypothetical protein IGB42_01427 [Andreprevotia sp. IGB-42]